MAGSEATAGDDALVVRAVRRAKDGDVDAVRYLYVRFAASVYGYARSIVRDEHEAEDVTQQVFAKLLAVIGKYEQRGVPFSAWILRVTHNLAIDHLRRQRMVPSGDLLGRDEAGEDEAINSQRARCLKDALAQLPTDQRQVLILRHVVGMSPHEIASRLGKSERSIHGLHNRGRHRLKAALVELDAAPTTATLC